MKFRVGDAVSVRTTEVWTRHTEGKVITIETDEEEEPYEVKNSAGQEPKTWWFSEAELEAAHHVAVAHLGDARRDPLADAVGRHRNLLAEELREARRDRPERELVLGARFGPAEVRREKHLGAVLHDEADDAVARAADREQTQQLNIQLI